MKNNAAENEKNWLSTCKAMRARLETVEQGLVSLILSLIILLATYQIGLRWLTAGGLPWIDPLLRYTVLWGGLLGAVLATARAQHISLDVVSFLVPDRLKPWLTLITCSFSAVIAGFLFRAAILFLQSEIAFGSSSLLGLPSWVLFLIFPISFAMISFHFGLSALLAFVDRDTTDLPQQSPPDTRT